MNSVRLGIVGMGNMGLGHAAYLMNGKIQGAKLTAVCDHTEENRQAVIAKYGEQLKVFASMDELFTSGVIDAVIIATPHYHHPEAAIAAFNKGLHVLIEKPAGVSTKHVRLMNEVAAKSGKVFSIMYNQRTNPIYQKLKSLIASGELGDIRRTNWIITNWYRSQAYYNSGGWRATWAGEGGGVLINQDPHQLDLWQWTIGMMPSRVRAFCQFGKYRNIEVDDDVTAYVEYPNGATGIFVTTTGEAPGTNRFEVTGDRGKIVIEHGKMTFWRLRQPESEFNQVNTSPFAAPECWECSIPVSGEGSQHQGITQNFVNAILHHEPLIAPGEEGIYGLTLSNAMYLSTWIDNWVELPIDEELFIQKLSERIASSTYEKPATTDVTSDLSRTFNS